MRSWRCPPCAISRRCSATIRSTVAAPEKLAALWQKCPFVDQVIALDKPQNLHATARQLRAGKFGSAVLLPNSLRSAAEAWRAGIPQRYRLCAGRTRPAFDASDSRAGAQSGAAAPALLLPRPGHGAWRPERSLAAEIAQGSDDGGRFARPGPGDLSRRGVRPGEALAGGKFRRRGAAFHRRRARRRSSLLGAPVDVPSRGGIRRGSCPEVENRVGKTSLAEFMAALVSARGSSSATTAARCTGLRAGRADPGHLRLDRAAADRADGRAQPGAAASRAVQPLLSCANARSISPA